MDRYYDLRMSGSLHLWGCTDCGSAVTNRSAHDAWHQRLEREQEQ